MKIKLEDIGAKEVSEDMKNAAIARKKAFVKKTKIPKGMERVKCPRCFGRAWDLKCPQDGCNGSGWIIRPKAKKVVAKVTKPVTITAKVAAAVKKVVKKKEKHGTVQKRR